VDQEAEVVGAPRVGQYVLRGRIASGGMAAIHLGRMLGAAGFERVVAIKRLHSQLRKDPQFAASFVDEARLAACIRHPNVVPTLDVVVHDEEILVVMDYVHGESLARLLRNDGARAPLPIVIAVVTQMLYGLHAAHEATNPRGEPLHLVHRDVSPQNVVVGVDGVARLVDFGVAKATWRVQDTRDGSIKGKIAYMAPEQLRWRPLDRRADVFGAAVVLWEALTGERLFARESTEASVQAILDGGAPPPSSRVEGLPAALDAIVLRGLSVEADGRFATALEMAVALEEIGPVATTRQIGAWVAERAKESLARRAQMVRELEEARGDEGDKPAEPTDVDVTFVPAVAAVPAEAELTPSPVSRAGGLPPPHRSRRLVGALAVATAAALIAVLAVVGLKTARREAPAAPASSAAAVLPPTPAPTPSTESAPAATPPAPVSAAASASAPTATPTRGRKPSQKPTGASTPSRPGCDPPYTIGPDGTHRFRPECI